ncbi:MmcQ/YjbR family DNA-binding protein [Notoacmeibacter marinus]|uniref:MmcQ/YjbR family DNA-binding protein n=1 Tax=Notoacmeibacter marinus TaxID=1876515 RepID=UPI0013B06143|nr:MmcQ/YjbR family DNA-binding protein [Notoacmeibacter marinus]
MRWKDVVELALQWPEVEESVSYGEPSLKVRKRLLTRHRVEDDSVVLLDVPADERDHLIEIMPEVFFCEPHYEGYETVLARLEHAHPEVIGRLLERRWRSSATKRALASFDR